jgi:LEA14-like dessication related protein
MSCPVGLRVVVAAALAAVGLSGLTGCAMIQKPTAEIVGVSVQNMGLDQATMLFNVKVDNPYGVALPLGNLDYALSSQGQRFLSGTAADLGTVPAGASKTLEVPVQLSYIELIRAVKEVRPGSTVPYQADLGLSMELPMMGSHRVPMSRDGQLTVPTTSSLLDRVRDLVR